MLNPARSALTLLLFTFVLVVYFCTFVNEDIIVFLSSSWLAKHQYGGLPLGPLHAWELKPFLNRYLIYLVSLPITELESFLNLSFENYLRLVKTTYLGLVLLGAFGLSRWHKLKSATSLTEGATIILALIFLLSHSFRNMIQAEYSALLIVCFLAWPLSSGSAYLRLAAAFLAGALFFLKPTCIVFFVQMLLLIEGTESRPKARNVFEPLLAAMIAIALATLGLFLSGSIEISDMLLAPKLQGAFGPLSLMSRFKLTFFNEAFRFAPQFPLFLCGVVASAAALLQNRVFAHRFALTASWILGWIVICIQGKFFPYHYVHLSIPVLHGLLTLGESKRNYIRAMLYAALGVGLVSFLAIGSPLETLASDRGQELIRSQQQGWDYLSFVDYIRGRNALSALATSAELPLGSALYLDSGDTPLLLRRVSYCRFFFPLPVQRARWYEGLKATASYRETLACILDFHGSLIVWDKVWIDPRYYPELEPIFRRIEQDYFPLTSLGSLTIYRKL